MVERIRPKPKLKQTYPEDDWGPVELVDGIRPFSVTLSVRHKGHQRRYYVGRVQVAYARPNGAEWVLDLIDATQRSNTYRFPSEAEMHTFLLEALTKPSRE